MNLDAVELRTGPGRAGFWFRAAELGPALGARRMGAGLYEARPGVPIWPYHYHHPDEEWLLVLSGAPVLREPSGSRTLRPGDLVAFPPGHRGAHTVSGPGRFVILSTRDARGPYVSVYPDSDKLSVVGGESAPSGLNALLLPRGGAVDYWHGEGEGRSDAATVVREPAGDSAPARRPVVGVDGPGGGCGPGLGAELGAERLDGQVVELAPDEEFGPFRYDVGRETWLVVRSGTPSLELGPERECSTLRPGDVVCLPEGPEGGRRLRNAARETARLLLVWTTGYPNAACHPDTGEWRLRTGPGTEVQLRDAAYPGAAG